MEEALFEIVNAIQLRQQPDSAWLDKLVRRRNREMHDGTRQVAKRRLLPAYLRMRDHSPEKLASWGVVPGDETDEAVVRLLKAKPRRTASGVATITILTKPWPCSGNCIYCPNDMRMPKSYLSDEPACQRAERNFFDPYMQVAARLRVLNDMGHVTDKIELIVLGGTFDDYPKEYQLWFVSEAFRALNDDDSVRAKEYSKRQKFYEECGVLNAPDALSEFVFESQEKVNVGELSYNKAFEQLYEHDAWKYASNIQHASIEDLERQHVLNELAAHRVVGLVVETRPDAISLDSLLFLRRLGCTKVQMGIQSLDQRILNINARGVTVGQIAESFKLLRLLGFKSHIHFMVNLMGATPESDIAEYRQLVQDPRFIPDEVKLYPCCLVESARLTESYESGEWVPYKEADLMRILVSDVFATPPFTRISRMIRDISATDILAGNKKTNLRQMVEQDVANSAAKMSVQEMRLREISTNDVSPADLHMETISYETTVSEERFLQWVTDGNKLAGFLRLSLPKAEAIEDLSSETECFPIGMGEAMIREVHIYGKVARLHEGGESAQHAGLGRYLIDEACKQAAAEGYTAANVISAIGTRQYYRSLGFEDVGLYQRRKLV